MIDGTHRFTDDYRACRLFHPCLRWASLLASQGSLYLPTCGSLHWALQGLQLRFAFAAAGPSLARDCGNRIMQLPMPGARLPGFASNRSFSIWKNS